MRRPAKSLLCLLSLLTLSGCRSTQPHITIGSKFFTEQVILAELLAQHIEARTGIHVERKTNLGGTLLCQKALESGQLDLYVEYTGTALTAVLNESPSGDSTAIYERVKKGYADRFNLEVTEPLGFENTFAMVVRAADAQQFHLTQNLRHHPDSPPMARRRRLRIPRAPRRLRRLQPALRPPLRRPTQRDGPRPHLPRPASTKK